MDWEQLFTGPGQVGTLAVIAVVTAVLARLEMFNGNMRARKRLKEEVEILDKLPRVEADKSPESSSALVLEGQSLANLIARDLGRYVSRRLDPLNRFYQWWARVFGVLTVGAVVMVFLHAFEVLDLSGASDWHWAVLTYMWATVGAGVLTVGSMSWLLVRAIRERLAEHAKKSEGL